MTTTRSTSIDSRAARSGDDVHTFSRREFLRLFGAGIVITFTLGDWLDADAQERRAGYPDDFNAYLRIGGDGRVTVFSGKIEMGQGVVTALAQMAAEELGVRLDAIDMVMGDTWLCPQDAGTWGSMSVRFFGPALRGAAAEARAVLVELAAERLGVAKEKLAVADGAVYIAANRAKRVTFGALANGQTIARHLTGKPALRERASWTVSGRSTHRTDGRDKVTGAALFSGDVRRPGLRYARVLLPPAHGVTLQHADTSAAAAMSGVTVFDRDGLVAVLADDPDRAAAAIAAVKAEWSAVPETPTHETIFDHLVAKAPEPSVGESKGDLATGRAAATKTFEHRWENGYGAHAPMEPHTAIADVTKDEATVWLSTQAPFPCHLQIAQALGMPTEKVRVKTPFVGGGFGGKAGRPLQAIHAAKLSQALGHPVQVAWTRAEEFFHDAFRPAGLVQIRSGLDAAGKLAFWDCDIWSAGDRSTEMFYDAPHHRLRQFGSWFRDTTGMHRFGTGPWRAPGANLNVFARESQIDVMAVAAGADPLAFRLANTSDARMRRVLERVGERSGWKPGAGPSGRGRGLACGIDAGSYVAMVAEVEVDRASGRVRVARVVCAQEMGQVINPEGAIMQIEGCVVMGLGYALSEELRFTGGTIHDRNFGTYRLPRFSDLPAIDAFLVENDALAPQGGGEPAIVTVGGAIANAIFDAVGARLHRMPMTTERVKTAMSG